MKEALGVMVKDRWEVAVCAGMLVQDYTLCANTLIWNKLNFALKIFFLPHTFNRLLIEKLGRSNVLKSWQELLKFIVFAWPQGRRGAFYFLSLLITGRVI